MATTVNPPRGMRDFLPAEKAHRERLLSVIRSTYRAHGFDEIETPVVEDSARLHSGLGGDNEKLGYAVLKRGITVDDLREATDPLELADLGLRFDLTVPLARFYASHRAELPSVFRAIQLAPVWRAERPQKGRYRQFVQCDIDIIGEAGTLAEVELITATASTLDALGLAGCGIRINDRRLLTSMLEVFGFAPSEFDGVLITLDKLDKIAEQGVIAELRERGVTPSAVDAVEAHFARARDTGTLPFGEAAIARELPAGVDPVAVRELAAVGAAALAALGAETGSDLIVFDPFLVRGMGYYTGTIFEVTHPSVPYSLGGGGRYDGMIGRFLGSDVPAVGFSLGFERIVDLLDDGGAGAEASIALVHDRDVPVEVLVGLKSQLIARGLRVQLAPRPKNVSPLLAELAKSGFAEFAFVSADSTVDSIERKPLA